MWWARTGKTAREGMPEKQRLQKLFLSFLRRALDTRVPKISNRAAHLHTLSFL